MSDSRKQVGSGEGSNPGELSPQSLGLHRFAVFTAAATFALIFIGGLVTSTGSALAVPDWPLSFGKFFPRMEGGVLYEHGHRMVAGAVAIMTLVLMVWTLVRERRAWVRYIAVGAFGLVVFQAVLGGLTVLFLLPLPIAVAHAGTAQAFFCLTVALSVFTNPRWDVALPHRRTGQSGLSMPALAAITTAVIYAQILIGAVMRHMGAGLAIPDFPLSMGRIVPPIESIYVAVNFAHRCGALAAAIFVVWTVARVLRFYGDEPMVLRPAVTLLALFAIQVALGALTVWTLKAVFPTTVHVAVGAGVLATSLVLTLRSYRLLAEPAVMRGAQERPVFASDRGRIEREVTA